MLIFLAPNFRRWNHMNKKEAGDPMPIFSPCQVEATAQPPAAAQSAVAPGTVGETPMVEREAAETHEVQHGAGNQWWFHEKCADAQVMLLHLQQRNHIWFSTPYLYLSYLAMSYLSIYEGLLHKKVSLVPKQELFHIFSYNVCLKTERQSPKSSQWICLMATATSQSRHVQGRH